MGLISGFIDSYRASKAITKAKRLKEETRRKHYVLKLGKKYYCFQKSQINTLKKKGALRPDLDFMMLDKVAYFITD